MANEETVVNGDQDSPLTTDNSGTTQEPTEGVTSAVDKSVYESVREAMKRERTEKRQAQSEVEQLRKRVEELEHKDTSYDGEPTRDPRLDVLYLVQKDSFVKENLDLIEQKMTDNPRLDVHGAVREIKAEMFDRIEKETVRQQLNQPQIQQRPTAVPEPKSPRLSGNMLEDALSGKLDIPAEQLAALKRVLKR